MRSKILKLIAVLAMCFMVIGALVACGEGAKGEAGAKGETGATGTGIASVVLNADGTKFVITYTDGKTAEVAIPSTKCAGGCKDVTVHEFKDFEHSATYNKAEEKWEFEDGKFLKVCNVCGASEIVVGVIHNFKEGTVAPTCTTIGFDGKYCLDCDYYEAIAGTEKAALDHSFTVKNDVIEDGRNICTEGSWQLGVCDRDDCGATKPVYVPAPGHTVETWNKNVAPTATQKGSLAGTCTVCGAACEKEIPAFNETDYVKAVEAASCLVGGKETWTYSFNEQTFAYEVPLSAKGHSVGGKAVDTLEKYEYADNAFAYIYGQEGIVALNVVDPKCGTLADGYYVCGDCGMSVSIKVYGDHVWGDPTVVPATCTSGTKTVKECTVEGCGVEDEKVADDKLDHSLVYGLIYLEGEFKFTTKCANCTTMDSSRDVTDLVELDEAGSKAAKCNEAGFNKYVYEYAVDKTVSCQVTVPATNVHTLVVNGAVVAPDANGYYSSAYIGKGITVLVDEGEEYPDVVTCGNTYDGFFVCVCGMNQSVTIINPHNLVLDPEDARNEPATCTSIGYKVWKCNKECCQTTPYTEVEPIAMLAHSYTYALVEDGDLWKVVGTCVCNDTVEYDGLTEDDFEEATVKSTCTTQGTYTITLKKQIAGITVPPLVTKLALAPHSVEAGKLLTDCELASEGVYKYNTKYFTALDLSGFICGETGEFEGYFQCKADGCGMSVKVRLAADHLWGEYKVEDEATCTEPGLKVAECKCGAKDEVVIDPTGHKNLTAVVTVVPSATAGGVLKITCSCGEFYNYDLPALTHPEFYAEFEVDEDDPDCYNQGTMKYTGKVAVPANGFFVAKEFDVEFTVITAATEHSAQPSADKLIVYTVEETIAGAKWDVTYTVYQCEICGKYIVVNADVHAAVIAPIAPAGSDEE